MQREDKNLEHLGKQCNIVREMAWYRRTGKMELSYQSTKGRVADETVRTTEGSIHSPARGSSSLIFYSQGLRKN